MSVAGGPDIIEDGLLMYLDAGNRDSYPGTGTTWTDLSIPRYSGTAANPPVTFDSGYGGSINANCQITISGTASAVKPANNFTYEVWARPASTIGLPTESNTGTGALGGSLPVIGALYQDGSNSGAGISLGTNGVVVMEHAGGYLPGLLVSSTTISSTLFTNITVIYNNKQPSLYINGVFIKTGLTSTRASVYADFRKIGYGDYNTFIGYISTAKVYNKTLSPTEILQNYNALKGRFGL